MTKPISTSSNVTQYNKHGDNIAGDKFVNNSVSPDSIRSAIEDTLTCLRHRRVNDAVGKLRTLKQTSQLSHQSKTLLDVLELLISIANESDTSDGFQTIDACHANEIYFVNDILTSAKMRLCIKNGKIDEAVKLFELVKPPEKYQLEVYYEFLADESELLAISSDAFTLNEESLCGLTRGFLRHKNFEQAVNISSQFFEKYPSFNSKVLHYIARLYDLNNQTFGIHFWHISQTQKEELLSLGHECSELIDECSAVDKRLNELATGLIRFTYGEPTILLKTCWKYIHNIEAVDTETAKLIRSEMEKGFEISDGVISEINQSKQNISFKHTRISELTNRTKLTLDEAFTLVNISDPKSLRSWLDRGGDIDCDNRLEKLFLRLEILCHAFDESAQAKKEIDSFFEEFINEFSSDLRRLDAPRLNGLASKLSEIGFPTYTCILLQQSILLEDIWLSPSVRTYINGLLESQQFASLRNVIYEINQGIWCDFVWQVNARLLHHQNDLDGAISSIEKAIEYAPHKASIWDYLIYLLKVNQTQINKLKEYIDKIPDQVFESLNGYSVRILRELDNHSPKKVENIISRWFIEDPQGTAKQISDFFFSKASDSQHENARKCMSSTDNCLGGFVYQLDGKKQTKIIVCNTSTTHPLFIDSSSPLAEILLTTEIGGTVLYNVFELTLLEKLPPYVAVARVATEIRHESNDGTDCFYMFNLTDDDEGAIETLQKKMHIIEHRGRDDEKYYKDPSIPLFMKGHMLGRSDNIVLTALHNFTTKISYKHPLPSFGVERPKTIILDVYSIVYLSLTGLFEGIEQDRTEIAITIETKEYLEHFIQDISRDDYMTVGTNEDGTLWRVTGDEILEQTTFLQKTIEKIFQTAEIVTPNLVDMPPQLSQIQDCFDMSVFSSMKISIANDIPWLCIDLMVAQLAYESNCPVVDCNRFLSSLSHNLDIEKKLHGIYLHVDAGLPYPLTYEELIQLSYSDSNVSHYYLNKILRNHPDSFQSVDSAILFMERVLVLSILKTFTGGYFRSSEVKTYTERLIYTCFHIVVIHMKNEETAELKFAKLYFAAIQGARERQIVREVLGFCGKKFIQGHFLSFDYINKYLKEYEQ